MDNYIRLLQEHKVSHLVCATDKLYNAEELEEKEIKVSELSFPDGSAPTQEIVEKWLNLVNKEFQANSDTCIGVHCVTGLGRAPVLVATALIELGMKYEVSPTDWQAAVVCNLEHLDISTKLENQIYLSSSSTTSVRTISSDVWSGSSSISTSIKPIITIATSFSSILIHLMTASYSQKLAFLAQS